MAVVDLKRISKEDFPSKYYDLIDKLAFPLNSFMEQVRNILDKNVSFDNLAQEIITLNVTTDANGAPLGSVIFKSNLINRVRGLQLINFKITSDNASFPTQMPVISFTQNAKQVTLNNISGLQANKKYELTLLVIS